MTINKICMYNITTTIKIGGIETFYWEVSKELQNQGYQVELISGEGELIKYEDIPLHQFSYISREKIWDLGNRFRKWGERISFFMQAWPYIKQQKYDIYLIHKPLDFFTAYFMKKNNPVLKIVFMSGGEDFYGFDRFFAKYIDYMFAVSIDNSKIIQQRYNRDIPVIANGVDIDKFSPMPERSIVMRKKYNLRDHKVLISVGRIVGWKGFQLVLEALIDLQDYHYVLIGEGEYLNDLKLLAKKFAIDHRVHFLGAIDNIELPKYLNMGDIFIQPSIGHEAFGITIIEAMACGLPVVASRNGGMVDIVQDDVNGYLFDTGNKEQLIKILSEKYEVMKTFKARIYVKQKFTWEKTVSELLKNINLK